MLELGPSARRLLRSRGFTATAVLVMALGIGAAAAMFSFVNAILLRPLPYKEPDRVAMVWETRRDAPARDARAPAWVNPRESFVSALNLESWEARQTVFESLEPVAFGWYHLPGAGQTLAGRTGPGFFHMLGVEAALGRTFTPEDAGKPVAVLTYALWQRVFGGDPGIVGRKIALPDDPPLTVVGVLPRGFFFYLRDFELWTPLDVPARWRANRADRRLMAAGRLKPGVTAAAAQAAMDTIARGLERSYPGTNRGWGVTVVPVRKQFTSFLGPILLVLFGGVGLLLLVACANIANLLLARAASRRKEFAIRGALGATRANLIGLMAGESLLLALPGGLGGLLLARAALPALVRLLPVKLPIPIPGLENIAIDLRVFLFTCAVSVAAAVLAGVVPAFRSSTADLRRHSRTADALVVSEIALATVLLAATGLTAKSVWILFHQDMGFRPGGILTFRTPLGGSRTPEQRARVFANYLSQVRALPGVVSAAVGYSAPLNGASGTVPFEVEGRPPARPGDVPRAGVNQVGTDYFRTLGIPLRAGRDFDASDTPRSMPVVLVSRAVAGKYFRGEDPVGRRIRLRTPQAPWWTIAGIVGDVRPFANGAARAHALPARGTGHAGSHRIRRANRGRSHVAQWRRAGCHRSGGCRPAGDLSASHVGRLHRSDLSAAAQRVGTRLFRRHGAAAGGRGSLRGDRVVGPAADARVRHPHGAGSGAGAPDGGRAGAHRRTGRCRRNHRNYCGSGRHALHRGNTVRGQARRSADLRGGSTGVGGGRGTGRLGRLP